jgi:hypothetical protein
MTGFGGLGFQYRVSGREGRESCAKDAKEYRNNSLLKLSNLSNLAFKKPLNDIFLIASYQELTTTLPSFSINSAVFNPFGCFFAFFAQLSRPSRPEIRY